MTTHLKKNAVIFAAPLLLAALVVASCAGLERLGEQPAVAGDRAKAQAGDVKSAYGLGSRYISGNGVKQDYAVAAEWFRRAAEGGHTRAQYMLGIAYYTGRGVDRDARRAAPWFEKAATAGNARAQYQLGDAYANGRGVAKERAWAARWFAKAAMNGHREAQYSLGAVLGAGLGVPVDRMQAAKWLAIAEGNGHTEALTMRKAIYGLMTPDERLQVERLAASWTARPSTVFADEPTVRFVQVALIRLGYEVGPVDGIAGPGTMAAVVRYRQASGLPIGGITPEVLEPLRAALAAAVSAPSR